MKKLISAQKILEENLYNLRRGLFTSTCQFCAEYERRIIDTNKIGD